MTQYFDAVIIGAGAAGLFCAGIAAQRGCSVLLIDHSEKVAEKIRISGGGRANFTNRDLDIRAPEKHFISDNPRFCRSALSRYTPQDFMALMQKHGIAFHEKHKGQLFCDRSAEDLIAMLLRECESEAVKAAGGSVSRWQPCAVQEVYFGTAPEGIFEAESAVSLHKISAECYQIDTDHGVVYSRNLVIATGGLSIPKIGATDFGYRLAKQFGHSIIEPRPALVPLTFDDQSWQPFAQLAGLALPVQISTGDKKQRTSFDEDVLFTHRGLSGPSVLQISSYWASNTPIRMNLLPGTDIPAVLTRAKQSSRKLIANELAAHVPSRLADAWAAQKPDWQRPINEASDKALSQLAEALSQWSLTPSGTEGYKKAEVTAGGVNTRELSSQTMESQKQPGLYFIGEVMDVTGWLGGYNFQWAWASGYACGMAVGKSV
ncbi:MAG: NAD(P)/FAD-dependent oxidoreductase [Brachymonas sp.]|nr:NAD(P)/FAD-dependent oxidoreductase [Brachymonas sp.]